MDGVQPVLDLLSGPLGGFVACLLAIWYLLRELTAMRKERDLWIDRTLQGVDLADKGLTVATRESRRQRE